MSRWYSATALAGVALAFALPFGTVSSCTPEETVRFTGADLLAFSVPRDDARDGTLHEAVERHASAPALGAFLAALLGAGLAVARRPGVGVCAAAVVVLLQLLGYAIATASDGSEFLAGFWLALALATTAGLAEARARYRRGWSASAVALVVVALVLPPLGLIVAVTCWIVAAWARAFVRAFRAWEAR